MLKIKLKLSEFKIDPLFLPDWCNTHCYKMKPILCLKNKSLSIKSSAADLTIIPAKSKIIKGWFVRWQIIHDNWSKSSGRIIMDSRELKAAFGLSNESDQDGDWLLKEYGGDSAAQGKYIRWRNYLNIPCAGTGHDGDPNISIKVDETIRLAVQQLLSIIPLE